MNLKLIYELILLPWAYIGALTCIILLFISAPYGRFSKSNWGPMISSKAGWIIQESVSPIIFGLFFLLGKNTITPVMWIFFIIWVGHYFHRSFIYPFRQGKSANMPIVIMLSAVFFNIINGFTNGYYMGNYSHNYTNYFFEPNFIFGIIIFLIGLIINIKSDNILLKLKKENKGYQVPNGFLYSFVTCPNYLGEILEWVGYAIMTWCLPGLVFALWTMFNLIPRAIAHHEWYHQKFSDYPKKRKVIFPFIL